MAQGAKVISVDAIREFRAALASFCTEAMLALGEGQSDVQRTIGWITGDQHAHWQREHKKRMAKVAQAKSDLFRAQIQKPSTVTERKALDVAERRVEEAEQKIRMVKKWGTQLERDMLLFKGQCQQMSRVVEAEIPATIAWIDRMIVSIEAYLAVGSPGSDPGPPPPLSVDAPEAPATKTAGTPGDATDDEAATGDPTAEQERKP